jgi:hypothetical protein
MLLRDLSSRKRITPAAIRDYVEAVHLSETGHPCTAQEVEMTLDWTRNPRYRDAVSESRRYRARVVNAQRSYWVAVALWRLDGDLSSATVTYHGQVRP